MHNSIVFLCIAGVEWYKPVNNTSSSITHWPCMHHSFLRSQTASVIFLCWHVELALSSLTHGLTEPFSDSPISSNIEKTTCVSTAWSVISAQEEVPGHRLHTIGMSSITKQTSNSNVVFLVLVLNSLNDVCKLKPDFRFLENSLFCLLFTIQDTWLLISDMVTNLVSSPHSCYTSLENALLPTPPPGLASKMSSGRGTSLIAKQ